MLDKGAKLIKVYHMSESSCKNGQARIIVPPFQDSHIHFTVEGAPANPEELYGIKKDLLRSGIMAVCDCGHKSGIGLEAKKLLTNDMTDSFRIKSAGRAIYKKGTYGVFLGMAVSSSEEIKRAVDEIANQGADFIKVINSGIVHFNDVPYVTPGGFDYEELKVICESSRIKGLQVKCHANSDAAVRSAVNAGASSIEHGYFISNETILMMAEKNVSWTPTVFALLCFASILPPAQRTLAEEVVEHHLSSINYASSVGVNLRVGTDSGSKGVRHGNSFFEELRLFQKAGLSFEQITKASCLGMEEIGKGNFLEIKKDFITSGEVVSVFTNGKCLFPS